MLLLSHIYSTDVLRCLFTMAPKIVKFLRRTKSAKADMRSHDSTVEHSFVDSIPYENSNEELNVSKGPSMS